MDPFHSEPNIPPQEPSPTPQLQSSTPLSQQPADYTHPTTEPPKRSYHPKQVMVGIAVFAGVCVVAVATMFVIALLPATKDAAPTKPTETKKPAEQQPAISAKLAIAHTKEYFKGTQTAKTPLLLPVQTPSRHFYTVIPDMKPLVSVAGSVEDDKAAGQLQSIIHSFVADSFTQAVVSDGTAGSNYQSYFTTEHTICELDETMPKKPQSTHWFAVKCIDMSSYEAYAKKQDTFAGLYKPLTASSVLYGFVGVPRVANGTAKGYQRAQIQVGSVIDNKLTSTGKNALYYRTPDGIWHYFTDQDASVAVECERYDTQELRNTYSGQPCRSLKSGSMDVVPDPKKR